MAGDRTCALEWLQPRRFRDALLSLHRRDGHSPFSQGLGFLFRIISIAAHEEVILKLYFLLYAEDTEPTSRCEESGGQDAQAAVLGHHLARWAKVCV